MDETLIQTSALPWPLPDGQGSPVPCRPDAGWARRVGAHVKRIRMLELLHEHSSLAEVAEAIGTYPREVRRVGWRYLNHGVQAALTDDPRPKPPKLLDTRQQAAIVAMVCGPPPAGYARRTVRVTTKETQRRGIVADVGRDRV